VIGALYAYPLDKILQPYKDKDGTDTLELVEAHIRGSAGIKPESQKEGKKELEDKEEPLPPFTDTMPGGVVLPWKDRTDGKGLLVE
jgi:hypothetical protein